MRDSFQDMEDSEPKALKFIQQNDNEMQGIDELSLVACEMVRLIFFLIGNKNLIKTN